VESENTMKSRVGGLLAAALLVQFTTLAAATTASAAPSADAVGQPGELNAITDVPGIRVGQVQSDTAPYLTGTTVVYLPRMSVASVDQRGGAPATKETDLLSPLNSNPGVNAIQLGGSSMYGLSATNGVIRWLEDRGEGVPLGPAGVAPIVPAADIYDLARGGDPKARTSAEWGYLAAEATADGPVRQGSVGGATGSSSGGLRSGVGTASVDLGNGIYVGAIVIVNSAGSGVNPANCTLWGAQYGLGNEFAGLRTPGKNECHPAAAAGQSLNTTIAVVATNAPLEKAAAQRMSGNAHDGMARAINPIHTLDDGDTVFAVSTGTGTPLRNNNPADDRQLNSIYSAGATTLTRAITHALLAAQSTDTRKSYCDTYPSACKHMSQLNVWRNAGKAPDVTPASFKRATKALQQTPVPWPHKPRAASSDGSGSNNGAAAATGGSGGSGGASASAATAGSGVGSFVEAGTAGLAGLLGVAGLGFLVWRRRPTGVALR
jgi:L-aminopeptidase/D-esterase-like protein